ncbi:MAG: hypothetical protein PHV99_02415 [Candidatus Pacebacteria bacterium]|nr:hypothetical protein [Candidatus Paceibacterota bacterium]
MRVPVKGKKIGTITKTSLAEVGHAMQRGAIIVDNDGKPVPALRTPVRLKSCRKIRYDLDVFNPGPQYDVCFDPKAPPHLAMVDKA